MSDNTQLNTNATSGDIISSDVITTLNGGAIATGEKAQRVKVGWGIDATFNDTSATNPLPVSDAGGSLSVDNMGTFAIQDSEKLADNAGFTDGTTKVVPVGYVFDEVAGTPLTENDIGASRIDSKRAIVSVIEDSTTRGQRASVDATGALLVNISKKTTYRASTTAVLVPAVTSPNPWFTIYGSATKTIRVQSIIVSGITLTAVAYVNIGLRKYSTAVSGGTSTALTQMPLDANSAASTATNVNAYTAIPTAGTTVGDISSRRVLGQATTAAATGIPQIVDFDFSPTGDTTSVILRGTAQGIGLYFITAPATTISCLVRVEWTEE